MDPRHLARIQTVQNLYALSYGKKQKLPFDDEKTNKIIRHLVLIDNLIQKFAKKFPLEKVAKTDLAILRLSVYDLVVEKSLPKKVVINEAIELAKELSGEKSYSFINAILGKIVEEKN